jgi:type I restriction enzyme S subunit
VVLVSRLNPRKATICRASPHCSLLTLASTEFVALKPTTGDIRFLEYLVSSELFRQRLDSWVQSVTRSHQRARPEEIYRFWNAWPDSEEQRAIADFLDRETAKIDMLVGKKRTLIERLKEKRTALISRTVTRGLPPDAARAAGLDPHPRLKPSGIDWLGEVPEHWDVDRLKWTTTGTVNGIWGDEPNGVDDLICVRVADFDRERFVVADNPPTLRAVEENQRSGRLLRKGDLLIEKSGGGEKQLVGAVVYFDHDFSAVCSNFVARMPIAARHSARFWTYVHAALYAGRLNYPAVKQTTGIQNLDSAAYLDTVVGFPPKDEQLAISSFLDRETGTIDGMVAKVETAIERLQEYRTALITATVTGKIDVRNVHG